MRRLITIMLTFTFLIITMFSVTPVFAGIFDKNLANDSSINGSIDVGTWYTPVQNPGVEYDGGIAFKENSTKNSSVFSKTKLVSYKDAGFDKFLELEADLQFSNINEGVKFGVVFGRSTLLGQPVVGKAKSSFVYFTKSNGKLALGVSKYDVQEQEIKVVEPMEVKDYILSDTERFTLKLSVTSDGNVSVKLLQGATPNSSVVYQSQDANLHLNGYVGFGQTGNGTVVTISHVDINALANSTPENSNIYEDFSYNSFNLNELYTRAPGGNSYIKIQDGKLVFNNITTGYVSTKKLYSNFDLTLEMPNVGAKANFDENFNLVSPISSGISIAFGVDKLEAFVTSGVRINIFPGDGDHCERASHTVISVTKEQEEVKRVKLPSDLHVFDGSVNGNKPVNIKVKNNDGIVSVYIKIGNGDYKKAFNYDSGFASDGYVRIAAYQQKNRVSSFEIDKLVLVNTDYMSKVISVESRDSASLNRDFTYIDTWDDSDLLKSNISE